MEGLGILFAIEFEPRLPEAEGIATAHQLWNDGYAAGMVGAWVPHC